MEELRAVLLEIFESFPGLISCGSVTDCLLRWRHYGVLFTKCFLWSTDIL